VLEMKLEKTRVVLFILSFLLAVPLMLVACHGKTQPPPYFQVQKEPAEEIHLMLIQGELVLDNNGYLRVSGGLILWPYGYSLKIEGKEVWIIDDKGQAVARVGDRVKMGGGEIPKWAEEKIGSPLPEGAEGPYLLVGPVEKY
jgi:hypothetical protein